MRPRVRLRWSPLPFDTFPPPTTDFTLMKTRAAVALAAGKPFEVLNVEFEGPRKQIAMTYRGLTASSRSAGL
jgi:hypothetical protein